jgi:Ca2+-binding RTX toxin-like protein
VHVRVWTTLLLVVGATVGWTGSAGAEDPLVTFTAANAHLKFEVAAAGGDSDEADVPGPSGDLTLDGATGSAATGTAAGSARDLHEATLGTSSELTHFSGLLRSTAAAAAGTEGGSTPAAQGRGDFEMTFTVHNLVAYRLTVETFTASQTGATAADCTSAEVLLKRMSGDQPTLYFRDQWSEGCPDTGDETGENTGVLDPGPYKLYYRAWAHAEAPSGSHDSAAEVAVDLLLGDHICDNDPPSEGATIEGTAGDDVLCGGPGNDTILGMGGDDYIEGWGGTDTLEGGPDNDTIFGAAGVTEDADNDGTDVITGGPGNDVLWGWDGSDDIRGGIGDDTIYGDSSAALALGDGDIIDGGEGIDTIYGAEGTDTIEGGPNRDFIFGGRLRDFIFGQGGTDRIFGGHGNDELSGGDHSDRIVGGDGPDEISGDGGNDDHLAGGEGMDTIRGGHGLDELVGNADGDRLFGDGADDMLEGDGGLDTIFGGGGDDLLIGGPGNDTLNGEAGGDDVFGGEDDDTTRACDNEEDELWGGLGTDVVYRDPIDVLIGQETRHVC